MITGNKNPDYIRHVYKVNRELKSYTIYQIVEIVNEKNQLTDLIRIEKYNNKSNATGITDYLRLRTTTNWDSSEKVTGLRPTSNPNLFYGDRRKPYELDALKGAKPEQSEPIKRTLLMFLYSEDRQTLYIDVYRGFYPIHKGILQNIITACYA